jgi:hypothetical protein
MREITILIASFGTTERKTFAQNERTQAENPGFKFY